MHKQPSYNYHTGPVSSIHEFVTVKVTDARFRIHSRLLKSSLVQIYFKSERSGRGF